MEPSRAEPMPKLRWFRVTPDRLVLILLPVEVLVWLLDRFGWFAPHQGYAVLTTVAGLGVTLGLMFAWFAVALVFRRRFQFSLQSLLLLTVVVALPCGWLAFEMKNARMHREVLEALYRRHPGDYYAIGSLHGPLWWILSWVKTFSLMYSASSFQLASRYPSKLTDSDLELLSDLRELRGLLVEGEAITDAGLEHLVKLAQLRWLELRRTSVSDEGVKKLQRVLPGCKITRSSPISPTRRAAARPP